MYSFTSTFVITNFETFNVLMYKKHSSNCTLFREKNWFTTFFPKEKGLFLKIMIQLEWRASRMQKHKQKFLQSANTSNGVAAEVTHAGYSPLRQVYDPPVPVHLAPMLWGLLVCIAYRQISLKSFIIQSCFEFKRIFWCKLKKSVHHCQVFHMSLWMRAIFRL